MVAAMYNIVVQNSVNAPTVIFIELICRCKGFVGSEGGRHCDRRGGVRQEGGRILGVRRPGGGSTVGPVLAVHVEV